VTSFSDSNVAPIRGSFGSIPNDNTPTVDLDGNMDAIEPISTMLQGNPDIGNMDWQTWDRTILQYNDPNNAAPIDWSVNLPPFDSNTLLEFDSDAWMMNVPTLDNWPESMTFQQM
jgi:hypothetical protein